MFWMANAEAALARADGERGRTAFEGGDSLLEHVAGWVHDAGVDVTELLEGEQVRRMLGPAELVGCRLVDRHSYRSCRRIGSVGPSMQDERLGILGLDHLRSLLRVMVELRGRQALPVGHAEEQMLGDGHIDGLPM